MLFLTPLVYLVETLEELFDGKPVLNFITYFKDIQRFQRYLN